MTTSQQRRRSNSTSAVQAARNQGGDGHNGSGASALGREEAMPGWKPPRPVNAGKAVPGMAF